ncbi:MAG: hypothetical protein LH606_03130 [Cytophagaceae bacterium]|nr:hypothetical protein [Cytophagaceae bacterium]
MLENGCFGRVGVRIFEFAVLNPVPTGFVLREREPVKEIADDAAIRRIVAFIDERNLIFKSRENRCQRIFTVVAARAALRKPKGGFDDRRNRREYVADLIFEPLRKPGRVFELMGDVISRHF